MSQPIIRRKRMRLQAYDYRTPALYHVVLCTQHRLCRFGRVWADEMHENAIGAMLAATWDEIALRYPKVSLDAFVIMPNHLHGIVFIEPQPNDVLTVALGDVVRWFKTATTVRYGQGVAAHGWPRYDRRLWQRNFYDHVIRDDRDLEATRVYIDGNPATWHKDSLFMTDAAGGLTISPIAIDDTSHT